MKKISTKSRRCDLICYLGHLNIFQISSIHNASVCFYHGNNNNHQVFAYLIFLFFLIKKDENFNMY